jgi:hypothetical protein
MKRLIVSAAIAGAMMTAGAVTAPASAQPGWNSGAFWRGAPGSTWDRIQFLQQRIDRGIADNSLNRGEAMRAQAQLRNIRQQAWQMRRRDGGQLSGRDNAWLQSQLDNLSRRLRWARHNGW